MKINRDKFQVKMARALLDGRSLAVKIGCCHDTLSYQLKKIKSRREIKPVWAAKIAKALGCSVRGLQ